MHSLTINRPSFFVIAVAAAALVLSAAAAPAAVEGAGGPKGWYCHNADHHQPTFAFYSNGTYIKYEVQTWSNFFTEHDENHVADKGPIPYTWDSKSGSLNILNNGDGGAYNNEALPLTYRSSSNHLSATYHPGQSTMGFYLGLFTTWTHGAKGADTAQHCTLKYISPNNTWPATAEAYD